MAKADVAWQDKDGWGALHEAAECGHEEIVRALVAHGAHIGAQSKWGTPLHYRVDSQWYCMLSSIIDIPASDSDDEAEQRTIEAEQ